MQLHGVVKEDSSGKDLISFDNDLDFPFGKLCRLFAFQSLQHN